ncbi:MAG: hypothetical protein E7679_03300 [Ruminococcaceae bacterium]|nr:hypothetical protein [Oscillospiraceae bacterium]
MKRSRLPVILGTYSVILLACTMIAIAAVVWRTAPSAKQTVIETVIETEHIYVFLGPEATDEAQTTSEADTVWIIREYGERIGIFNESDELIDIIDVYTKTLPEADRLLLKEGIVVSSEKQLNSLIEDYSS